MEIDEEIPTRRDPTNVGAPSPPMAVSTAKYCAVTGCIMVPAIVDGERLWTNWVMSSNANIVGPAAAARIAAAAAAAAADAGTRPDRAPTEGDAVAGASNTAPSDNQTQQAWRAWPTVCQAIGPVRRPRRLRVAGIEVVARDAQTPGLISSTRRRCTCPRSPTSICRTGLFKRTVDRVGGAPKRRRRT